MGTLAEAAVRAAGFLAGGELPAQGAPASEVGQLQLRPVELWAAGCQRGDHAHRAAHDQPGGRALAAGGTPLVITHRAETLLQVVLVGGKSGKS